VGRVTSCLTFWPNTEEEGDGNEREEVVLHLRPVMEERDGNKSMREKEKGKVMKCIFNKNYYSSEGVGSFIF